MIITIDADADADDASITYELCEEGVMMPQ